MNWNSQKVRLLDADEQHCSRQPAASKWACNRIPGIFKSSWENAKTKKFALVQSIIEIQAAFFLIDIERGLASK